MEWKCVQEDWTNICVHENVYGSTLWYLYEICILNMVTSDLTKSWTENVSKYKIEQKSVYITWKTWDLTERWNENVSKIRLN